MIDCVVPAVYFILPFCAFLAALIVIPLVRKVAIKSGFVDIPVGRKQHDVPVPPIGGLVIFTVFLFFMVQINFPSAILIALAIILVVGIIDDAKPINARIKFIIHFVAAIILVVAGNAQIHNLGNLLGFGEINLGLLAIPFSVACVVYILNAVNMMDGVDGLAGGNSLVIFIWLALGANCNNLMELLLLMATIAAFLVYNMRSPLRRRASVFLGDAGSMAIGLMIAWFAINISQGEQSTLKPISVAWIIALPIIDAFGLLVARIRDGKPPFDADRRHFHHHFLNAGYSPQITTLIILLYSVILGGIGVFGVKYDVPEYILGWGWIVLWLGHTVLVIKCDKFIKFLQWIKIKLLIT